MNKKILVLLGCAFALGLSACDDGSSSGDIKTYKSCGMIAHGQTGCNADNTAVVSCNDGQTTTVTACTNTQICNIEDNTPACIEKTPDNQNRQPCGVTAHGTKGCLNGVMVVCNNGETVEVTGDDACDDNQTCEINDDLQAVCVDNSCGTLLEGETRCSNDATKIVMCEGGKRVNVETCGDAKFCQENDELEPACVDKTPIDNCKGAKEGEKFCDGDMIAVCTDGNAVQITEGQCVDRESYCQKSGSSVSCVAYRKCGDTPHNAYTCDGDETKLCYDSVLEETTDPCGEDQKCVMKEISGVSYAACESIYQSCGDIAHGAQTCNTDKTQIATCNNGTLTDVTGNTACSNDQTCELSNGKPKCVDKIASDAKYQTIQSIHDDWDTIMDEETCHTSNGKTTAPIKTTVDITGIVTATFSSTFYIQDPNSKDGKHAGMLIHCELDSTKTVNCTTNGFATNITSMSGLKLGDKVRVVADGIGGNYCRIRVEKNTTNTQITLISNGNALQPIELTANQISTTNYHTDYDGTLATVKNVTVDMAGTSGLRKITDATGETNLIAGLTMLSQNKFKQDTSYNVVGIIGSYMTNAGILLRDDADTDLEEIEK